MRKLGKPLLKQRCDGPDRIQTISKEFEELHLLEHGLDVEPCEIWIRCGLLIVVERLLDMAEDEVNLTESRACPDAFVLIIKLRGGCEAHDGGQILQVQDFRRRV